MKFDSALAVVLLSGVNVAFAAVTETPVRIQDFESASPQPTVWVVNIPNENASVALSTNEAHDGKQSLRLHYRFVGSGNFQYLGIPNKVKIQAPIHKLRYWVKEENSKCSFGLQINDARGETHQFRAISKNPATGASIESARWKEVAFDLDASHETWGGDKNGKFDYPITNIVFTVGEIRTASSIIPSLTSFLQWASQSNSPGENFPPRRATSISIR